MVLSVTGYRKFLVGAWRSLEAHLNGVQGVGGSNPLAPTNNFNRLHTGIFSLVGECDSFVTLSGQSI